MTSSGLNRLLEHPAIWRGTSVARTEAVSTGFEALDERLPGKGWPRAGLVEVLIPSVGVGELYLLLPALAALTRRSCARWCGWIEPPFEPFAPALAAHGMALERLFVVRAATPLWAFEEALGSGACEAVLGWAQRVRSGNIRRLQLAAERGHALGILFRPAHVAGESSCAVLRLMLEPAARGARLAVLKSRGGRRGVLDLEWPLERPFE